MLDKKGQTFQGVVVFGSAVFSRTCMISSFNNGPANLIQPKPLPVDEIIGFDVLGIVDVAEYDLVVIFVEIFFTLDEISQQTKCVRHFPVFEIR